MPRHKRMTRFGLKLQFQQEGTWTTLIMEARFLYSSIAVLVSATIICNGSSSKTKRLGSIIGVGLDNLDQISTSRGKGNLPSCMGAAVEMQEIGIFTEGCKAENMNRNHTEPPSLDQLNRLCVMACVWNKLGLVEDETFTQDASTFVMKTFPPVAQPKILDVFVKCYRLNPERTLSMENDCSSYRPLRTCIITGVTEVCRSSPDEVTTPADESSNNGYTATTA